MYKTLIFAISAAVIASTSHAATITETTDFSSNLNFPSNIGTLDVGANSISGSLAATCNNIVLTACVGYDFPSDDTDAFAFVIPMGAELTSATLTISNLVGVKTSGRSFTDLGFLGFEVGAGVFDILGGSNLTGTQNYGVGLDAFTFEGQSGSASWTVDLTVESISAVPLPAGLPLLLAGLGAFGIVRRSRGKND